MRFAITIASVGTACGRIGFDPIAQCDVGAPFASVARLDELSSNTLDGGLRLSSDELVGYFHTKRSGGDSEIWTTSRSDRALPFDPPQPVIQSGTAAFWPTLDAAGLTLIYNDATDLLASTRASKADPFPIGTVIAEVDATFVQSTAFLSAKNKTLYLTHFEPEGAIYTAPWPPSTGPVALQATETDELEQAPAVSADELVIYFARGRATLDIFVTERPTVQDPFGTPVLVDELMSSGSESPTWLSNDRCRLYFESDRSGVFELYVAERAPE